MNIAQSLLLAMLLLTGCTNAVQMPWEVNLLDPGRIQTREPLEVPPDLHVLPEPASMTGGGKQEHLSAGESASELLFKSPSYRQVDPPISRDKKENLPDWLAPRGQKQ